jgi:enediyne polyketide synthase
MDLESSFPKAWQGRGASIVVPREDPAPGEALASFLVGLGARVRSVSSDEVEAEPLPAMGRAAQQVIGLLPRRAAPSSDDRTSLRRMIARLLAIASAAAPGTEGVAIVQFAGGRFGTRGPPPELECAAAAAFARSLHLERPELKVRVLDLASSLPLATIASAVAREAVAGDAPFAAVGMDGDSVRHVPLVRLQQPAAYPLRPLKWGPADLFLVTGGGRGVTAACALALARATGVRCALVGRSPHPTAGDHAGIVQTLDQFAREGLTARYYACDVADADAVHDLVRTVRAELGPITGLLHGAAANRPRRLEQTTVANAIDEVAAKVLGATHLCRELDGLPPRLLIGLTSVLGVTGMAGNAWYAFANESLDLLLRRFAASHPDTAVQSVAFSVWAETGMGTRLGTTQSLGRRGIQAIPTEEGTRRFVQLVLGDPGHAQVVVAGQLGGLDTWLVEPVAVPSGFRFLERIIRSQAGVELAARALLTPERDPYLRDHVYHGSRLFPAVFGLEAMAQAAVALGGDTPLDVARFEDVRLERPIVVDGAGAEIEVRAVACETTEAGEFVVDAWVRSEQTGFAVDHFAARVVLSPLPAGPVVEVPSTEDALPIEPEADLYGGLLFQGPLFRRLGRILELDGDHVVFESWSVSPEEAGNSAFAEPGGRLVLGDPFFRDVLLQAGQLTIPREECLPVRIDRLERFRPSGVEAEDGRRLVVAPWKVREGREYVAEVFALDAAGCVRERMTGCRLRILSENPENPSAEELAHPGPRDEQLLHAAVADAWPPTAAERLPGMAYAPLRGLHRLPAAERRHRELPLIEQALAQRPGADEGFSVAWQADGRPSFVGIPTERLDLSLTHDDHGSLCVVGPGPLGCDLTPVLPRGREVWRGLLGDARLPLLDRLVAGGDTPDRAGARIWSALEAARKATGVVSIELDPTDRVGDRVIFRLEGGSSGARVVTRPLRLTLGPERLFALVTPADSPVLPARRGIDPDFYGVRAADDGPQGQPVQEMRFLVSFQDACTPARKVPASRYLAWMGRLRELVTSALVPQLIGQIYSGEWGLVTNRASVRVVGELTANDVVQMRFWTEAPGTSTVEFFCDFWKVLPDARHERLAFAEQAATWVRIVGPGRVEPAPFPAYLRAYIADMGPSLPGCDPRAVPELVEPLSPLYAELGREASFQPAGRLEACPTSRRRGGADDAGRREPGGQHLLRPLLPLAGARPRPLAASATGSGGGGIALPHGPRGLLARGDAVRPHRDGTGGAGGGGRGGRPGVPPQPPRGRWRPNSARRWEAGGGLGGARRCRCAVAVGGA